MIKKGVIGGTPYNDQKRGSYGVRMGTSKKKAETFCDELRRKYLTRKRKSKRKTYTLKTQDNGCYRRKDECEGVEECAKGSDS